MAVGKKKSGRLDARLPDDLLSRFELWVASNPTVKDKTDALRQMIEEKVDNYDPDCGFLTPIEMQIIDDYRQSMRPIPTRRKILSDYIMSLKK